MAIPGDKAGLQPTQFRPTQTTPRFSFKLPTWWQWVIVGIAVIVLIVAWFLLTATAVRFESNAANTQIDVSGGIIVPSGPSYLMRSGNFNVRATAKGYEPLRQSIAVESQPDQLIQLTLIPLPGAITITGSPPGAKVKQGSEVLGVTPLSIQMPPGAITLDVEALRYQSGVIEGEVIGREVEQTFEYELRPDWANVTLPTSPSNAQVFVDDELTEFMTPGPIQVMAGERQIAVKSPGYEQWADIIFVLAGESVELEPVTLKLVGGTLNLTSEPSEASITIDGTYFGTTPISVDVTPNRTHRIEAALFGYQSATRSVNLNTGTSRQVHFDLEEVTGTLAVTTEPENAEIWVDGRLAGTSNTLLTLHAAEHDIELRKAGYAGYSTKLTIQSEFQQELKVRLLTHEEARLEALKQVRKTSEGHELILLSPTTITMGASRRQPGRRSNEVFQTVKLDRLFYLSRDEVTNRQFRNFASGHNSGSFENNSLNEDEQPVANVSWREAAQYCNWLSTNEGFEPFYILRTGDPPAVNPNSLGYRLPTEAEWAWAARQTTPSAELLHFPWGDSLPPPNYHGNYADRAAQHVIGRVIFNYNDNHTVSAPVGTFDGNFNGLNDMGGNVAEWIHNYYAIPTVNATVTNLGPEEGEYRVIRGSSWMHGTITDLRLSFRDYGTAPRRDVGFRLARFAE